MLRRRLLLWLFLAFALILSDESDGEEPARSLKEAVGPTQVERLIRELGNGQFKVREAATAQLEKIGPPAMEALRVAATVSKDPEVRRRAADIAAVIENGLEQLLIDYRSFDLPMPPENAPLVRYEAGGGGLLNGTVQPKEYGLALLVKPGNDTEPWILLQGTREWKARWDPKPQEVKPERDTIKGLIVGGEELTLAIQCQARGWRKLARHLLERYRKDGSVPPRQALIEAAWGYWEGQLTQPKIDRAPIAKRLKELIAKDKDLDTDHNRALLKSLELALIPSNAKPGSIEALIDGLVDYTANTGVGEFEPEDQYWRIAELGFDAVPALIEHLDDDRLTRGMMEGFNNFFPWHLRVRYIVSDLLQRLAGQDFERDWLRRLQGYGVEKDEAKKWWEEARKVGEERYLLDHVLPASKEAERPELTVDQPRRMIQGWELGGRPLNLHQLRIIRVKHSKQIPGLYRTILDKRPEVESWPLAQAVGSSTLPTKDKIDLFLYAARHKNNQHRLPALISLKRLDQTQFDARLLATIREFPDDVTGRYWTCPEAYIAALAAESNEPQVWQALEKAAKRAAVGFRMELLNHFINRRDKRSRPEQLRLLAAFLDDDASRDTNSSKKYERPCAGFTYKRLEVRDFVAVQLAALLGIKVELNPERTPAEWAQLRHKVREAMEQALGNDAK